MSGIAEVLLNLGYEVTGSDPKEGDVVARLAEIGARIASSHDAAHVVGADVVVVSSAIRNRTPRSGARALGIPVIRAGGDARRADAHQVLGRRGRSARQDDDHLDGGGDPRERRPRPHGDRGGRLMTVGAHARLGQGPFLVAEADESDGSFLLLAPTIAVITNIDAEHLDYHKSLEGVQAAFTAFVNRIPFYGDDHPARRRPERGPRSAPRAKRRALTYGFSPGLDLRGSKLEVGGVRRALRGPRAWGARGNDRALRGGAHNAWNALAALAAGWELGVPIAAIRGALRASPAWGAGSSGATIPRGALDRRLRAPPDRDRGGGRGARATYDRRIVAVFQPHRYTRTHALADRFANRLPRRRRAGDAADLPGRRSADPGGDEPVARRADPRGERSGAASRGRLRRGGAGRARTSVTGPVPDDRRGRRLPRRRDRPESRGRRSDAPAERGAHESGLPVAPRGRSRPGAAAPGADRGVPRRGDGRGRAARREAGAARSACSRPSRCARSRSRVSSISPRGDPLADPGAQRGQPAPRRPGNGGAGAGEERAGRVGERLAPSREATRHGQRAAHVRARERGDAARGGRAGTVLTPLERGLVADRPRALGVRARSRGRSSRATACGTCFASCGSSSRPRWGWSRISEIVSDAPGRSSAHVARPDSDLRGSGARESRRDGRWRRRSGTFGSATAMCSPSWTRDTGDRSWSSGARAAAADPRAKV